MSFFGRTLNFFKRSLSIFCEIYKLLLQKMVPSYQTTRSHTQQDCSNNPYCDESLKIKVFFFFF